MARRNSHTPPRFGWRQLVPALIVLGAVVGTAWPQGQGTPPAPDSDYSRRVVAFLEGGEVVTRQELGEYLIARLGAKKFDDMIKRMLIDFAAKQAGMSVTDAEVEAAFTEALQGLPRERFIKEVVRGYYGLSLFEWKEDRLRPKLLLTKICRDKLQATEEEIRRAFEATYGERVQVRMICWPKAKIAEVQGMYAKLRDDDDFFNEQARQQARGDLAASGGKLQPWGRYSTGNETAEKVAFQLKPGQVSEVVENAEAGEIFVLKCDKRLPADTTASLEAKREELTQLVLDGKLGHAVRDLMADLDKRAHPKKLVEDWTVPGDPGQAVAELGDGYKVTREMFGEYLIARYGAAKLELLVHARIIAKVCQAKGITVSKQEIDEALDHYVKARGATRALFEEKILKPNGQTLYEFREDYIRPELLMTKMVRPTVKATEEEIKQAFDAYHGEKVECRMILYPRGEERMAMQEFAQLRDSEEAFARKAKMQASPRLASLGGKVPPVGRHTVGNDELEREIFSLNPGEVSRLVGTPEGTVLIKVDRRVPPDATRKLEDERAKLTDDVIRRKTIAEVPRAFAELKKAANPRLLLKDPNRAEDLIGSVERELQQTGFVAPSKEPAQTGPPRKQP